MKKLIIILLVFNSFFLFVFNTLNLHSQSLREHLIAYWSFEDSTARDFSGNGYHGTPVNNPTPVPGIHGIGTAMWFEGRNWYMMNDEDPSQIGDHILVPTIDFPSMDEFTISLWAKEIAMVESGGEAYLWFGEHRTGYVGIMSRIQPNPEIEFSVGSNVNTDALKVPYVPSHRGVWIHYCMVYKDGVIKGWRDGEYIGQLEQEIILQSDDAAIARHWWQWSDGYRTSARYTGALDEIKIYDIALDEFQIQQDYQTCGNASFEWPYNSDYDIKDFVLIEDSQFDSDRIQLNGYKNLSKGALWYKDPVPVEKGFIAEFSFLIDDNATSVPDGQKTGSEGFAFVMQGTGNDVDGQAASGIGYEGLRNSLAVEFDFYNSSVISSKQFNDPNDNHVAVQISQSGIDNSTHNDTNTLAINSSIPNIDTDGKILYHARIDYNAQKRTLQVFLDTGPKHEIPIISVPNLELGDLIELLENEKLFIGFTGSCSGFPQRHQIMSFSFCPFECDPHEVPEIDGDMVICRGQSSTLSVDGQYNDYRWSTGEYTQTISVDSPGTYSVICEDSVGCESFAEVSVKMVDFEMPEILPDLDSVCISDTVDFLTKQKYEVYHWSDGSSGDMMSVAGFSPGINTFSVEVRSEEGCVGYDTVEVYAFDIEDPKIENPGNAFCKGDTVRLGITGNYDSHLWSNGSTESEIAVTEEGEYSITVTKGGCSKTSEPIVISYSNDSNIFEIIYGDEGDYFLIDSCSFAEKKFRTVKIRNTSDDDQYLKEAYFMRNVEFSVPQSQFELLIPGKDTAQPVVCFAAVSPGIYYDTLIINDKCTSHKVPFRANLIKNIYDTKSRCQSAMQLISADKQGVLLSTLPPYPNPASDVISIPYSLTDSLPNDREEIQLFYVLTDLLGTQAAAGEQMILGKHSDGILRIPVSGLSSGCYYLKLSIMNESAIYPVLINP